jgi:hypothetical protein
MEEETLLIKRFRLMTDQSLRRVVELLRGFVTSAHSSPSVIHAVIICLRRFAHVTFAHFGR